MNYPEMKAILEIDAPESCHICPLSQNMGGGYYECHGEKTVGKTRYNATPYSESRAPFCPLKIVEEQASCDFCGESLSEPKTVFEDMRTWSIERMATFISEIDHTTDYEEGDYDPAIMAWLCSEKKSEVQKSDE